jgi:hypothetical protein
VRRIVGRRRVGLVLAALLSLPLGLLAAAPAQAQSLSTADLAGTWSFFQVPTPGANVSNTSFTSVAGPFTFNSDGTVAAGTVNDSAGNVFTFTSGSLSVTASGVVTGSLAGNASFTITLPGARMLTGKQSIVGVGQFNGNLGLFNFVKQPATPSFTPTDLEGTSNLTWGYHELTPSNDLARSTTSTAQPGDAAWVSGSITFHAGSGCTDAALSLSDGTVRSVVTASPSLPFG